MRTSITQFIVPMAVAAVAAIGGALIVYSEYDDAPGGVLIGLFLIGVAVVVGARAARRE